MKKAFALAMSLMTSLTVYGCSDEKSAEKETNSIYAELDDPEWRSGYLKFLDSGQVYSVNQLLDLDYFFAGIVFEECKFALVEVANNEIPELLMFDGTEYALVRCDYANHNAVAILLNSYAGDWGYVGSQKVSDIWSSKKHYSNEEIREVIRGFGKD